MSELKKYKRLEVERMITLNEGESVIITGVPLNDITTYAARWNLKIKTERAVLVEGTKENPTVEPVIKITKL